MSLPFETMKGEVNKKGYLETRSIEELRDRARRIGLTGVEEMSREQLIEAIAQN